MFDKKIIDLTIKNNIRKGLTANIIYNNKKINITNIHLHTNTNLNKDDQEDENIRYEQINKLYNSIKNNYYSLLLGDFNSLNILDYSNNELNNKYIYEFIHTPKYNKVINYITKYYKDSYNMDIGSNNLYTSIYKRRVDYILYKNLNIKKYCNLSNFNFSDHSMIFIEI